MNRNVRGFYQVSKMRKYFQLLALTLIGIMICCHGAAAQVTKEKMRNYGRISNKWLVLVNQDRAELQSAEMQIAADGVVLSTYYKELSDESLVTGVVLTDEGQVYSNPLHHLSMNELEEGSIQVAEAKLKSLNDLIANLNQQISKLEAELDRTTRATRAEAGLAEVDKIYDKISQLNDQIESMKIAEENK